MCFGFELIDYNNSWFNHTSTCEDGENGLNKVQRTSLIDVCFVNALAADGLGHPIQLSSFPTQLILAWLSSAQLCSARLRDIFKG